MSDNNRKKNELTRHTLFGGHNKQVNLFFMVIGASFLLQLSQLNLIFRSAALEQDGLKDGRQFLEQEGLERKPEDV